MHTNGRPCQPAAAASFGRRSPHLHSQQPHPRLSAPVRVPALCLCVHGRAPPVQERDQVMRVQFARGWVSETGPDGSKVLESTPCTPHL